MIEGFSVSDKLAWNEQYIVTTDALDVDPTDDLKREDTM